MKGYKGFNQNLQCRGFQYEIGKTYHIKEKPTLCDNGFHFCKKLADVNNFYDLRTSRICEIEAFGSIEHSTYEEKSVCNSITIIRELIKEEILLLVFLYFYYGIQAFISNNPLNPYHTSIFACILSFRLCL